MLVCQRYQIVVPPCLSLVRWWEERTFSFALCSNCHASKGIFRQMQDDCMVHMIDPHGASPTYLIETLSRDTSLFPRTKPDSTRAFISHGLRWIWLCLIGEDWGHDWRPSWKEGIVIEKKPIQTVPFEYPDSANEKWTRSKIQQLGSSCHKYRLTQQIFRAKWHFTEKEKVIAVPFSPCSCKITTEHHSQCQGHHTLLLERDVSVCPVNF